MGLSKFEKKQKAKSRSNNKIKPAFVPVQSVYKRKVEYPSLTNGIDCPKDRFLTKSDKLFDKIMENSYKGFCLEEKDKFSKEFHEEFKTALEELDETSTFQFDMTQPAGLGTPVAKTFVTRCLVGEEGTTYKYLGLRMFSIPWTQGSVGSSNASISIGRLNRLLVERTKNLLKETGKELYGSCEYNLTLINRCFPLEETGSSLKNDPIFNKDKCCVSWHADSGLVHYSSIAVYQYAKETSPDTEHDWKVALRVMYDAEGPNHGNPHTSRASEMKTIGLGAPPLAVTIPNQSAYFLLDDFNHHHQHAVIAGHSHRYASTHRVSLMEGHSFQYIKAKCVAALQGSSNFGSKSVRIINLTSIELEFEWIQQYYIQGSAHHNSHVWWHERILELNRYWENLESSICRSIVALYDASSWTPPDDVNGLSNHERKIIAKRQKRMESVEVESYVEVAAFLIEKHEKRIGWRSRQSDHVFRSVDVQFRPMQVPLMFDLLSEVKNEVGEACNTCQHLSELAAMINLWKTKFLSRKGK